MRYKKARLERKMQGGWYNWIKRWAYTRKADNRCIQSERYPCTYPADDCCMKRAEIEEDELAEADKWWEKIYKEEIWEMNDQPRKDCDLRNGDIQCSAKFYRTNDDGYLNCRFIQGHYGKHQTYYVNGQEWGEV